LAKVFVRRRSQVAAKQRTRSAGRKANVARGRELLPASPRAGGDQRVSTATGSSSTVPLLRWSHGRYRDFLAGRSGGRAAVVLCLYRNVCSMTHRNDFQDTAEAVTLRHSGDLSAVPTVHPPCGVSVTEYDQPARAASGLYRAHKRVCAFKAMSRTAGDTCSWTYCFRLLALGRLFGRCIHTDVIR
jgi:hypothetical protein